MAEDEKTEQQRGDKKPADLDELREMLANDCFPTRSATTIADLVDELEATRRILVNVGKSGDVIAVPRRVAELVRRGYLPLNPNKVRTADPEVLAALREFIRLVERG